ncbi:beta-(1-2)-fructofuranosidase [Bifidobacterium sp. UTCIF-39]|uniref:glycoside hydrolase family 32 protein n=1 Tax=Bifidobacterium sp. UTCIF-39 TaxID=1465359 RepID=UPI00112811D0|nr:GH32 C-terminal domain-containing protein [Bifidobacterium sp. UTCIF-39]TPF96315.1 beta-(1-2)-fructofuranosidase [Bifidobacterium sp. UTCIF-39]
MNDINREFVSHDEALARAEAGVAKLAATRNDRWYPKFHIASNGGWINDPNGLCYYRGRWHVYYQLHPYSTQWGSCHWGHVSSDDMITWKREPIAFAPSLEADRDGVFSGSAVTGDDGRLWVFYTGHRWANGVDDADDNLEVQCAAVSDDGVHFEKLGVIIDNPKGFRHFRDPKVWKQDGMWYMVFGMSTADARGEVLLYSSENMRIWHFEQVLFRHPNPGVYMLECPDFFPVTDKDGNEKWVIGFSAMGSKPSGFMNRNANNAGYMIGTWEPGGQFTPETEFRLWDCGHNFYAPQSFNTVAGDTDDNTDGRQIMYGWYSPFVQPIPLDDEGWCGQLTLPREVFLGEDGDIHTVPAAEMAGLREDSTDLGVVEVKSGTETVVAENAEAMEIEMTIDLKNTTADRAGIKVHATPDGSYTYVAYDDQIGGIVLDRQANAFGDRGYRVAPLTADELAADQLTLRIYVDRGSVEVYVNDGHQTMSSYSYAADGPRAVKLVAESGDLTVASLTLHNLKSIGLE